MREFGYKVSIVLSVYSSDLLIQDAKLIKGQGITTYRISDLSIRNARSITDKIIYKLGRIAIQYFGLETVFGLGYGAYRYLAFCKNLKADLFICHQEMATYAGMKLIKSGAKVGFDFEDWYSEDLLPAERARRPLSLLRKAEAYALRHATFVYTTSHILARTLADHYKSRLPEVIYNVFPAYNLAKSKQFNAPLKLIWFSQTIGPGRGLEAFIGMLKKVAIPIELHLLGKVSLTYKITLQQLADSTVYFHDVIPPDELHHKISTFDIGLALEMSYPASRNLTITNKLFQYMQAGLPVIATTTAGQREIFEQMNPGFMLAGSNLSDDIEALRTWLEDSRQLMQARYHAIDFAEKHNWETESSKLNKIISRVFET